jgi:hypothetical protein
MSLPVTVWFGYKRAAASSMSTVADEVGIGEYVFLFLVKVELARLF